MKTIIPDTSAVIEGAISKIIAEEDLDYPEIIVPEAVVCELEHQANANRNEGINGLKELQKLQEAQDNGELAITFKGKRPTNYDIKYAKSGEIDSLIRDLARSEFGQMIKFRPKLQKHREYLFTTLNRNINTKNYLLKNYLTTTQCQFI